MAVAGLLLLMLSGCGNASVRLGPLQAGGAPAGSERQVPLHVLSGPEGQVIALVPVFIADQGPLTFALDTGASRSVVGQDLLGRLGLQPSGESQESVGVSGTVRA